MTDFPNTTVVMENSSYPTAFNVTEHYLEPYAKLVDRICTPFIYVIGFPGNTLSLIIWLQKRMRHSSGYYLAALAFNDLIFLLLQILYELETAWGYPVLSHPGICEIFPTFWLTVQYLSPLLVLAFTTERYISICHPFKRETYCTVKRAKIVIACLTIFYLLLNCVNSYFFYYDVYEGVKMCSIREEVIVNDHRSIYSIYNISVQTLACFIVPMAILFLNILVICEMRRMSRMNHVQQPSQLQRAGSTMVMLLSVSFYQILTTLPISVTYLMIFEYAPDPRHHFAIIIVNEYGMTHYAFNIFIYIATGSMFRQELKKLLIRPFAKIASSLRRDYSSLRTTVKPSSLSTWVSVNGAQDTPRLARNNYSENKPVEPSETLL